MKKGNICRLIIYSVLLGFVLLPALGNALDLSLEPRFQAGIMDYQFEQKSVTTINDAGESSTDHGFKIISDLPFVGSGATLFANRFFIDFYAQKAFSGSDSATNSMDSSVFENTQLNIITRSDFDREEYSVSLGYAVGSQWAVFGGYRTSKTNFTNILTQSDDVIMSTENGDYPSKFTAKGKRNVDFKQDGYFLGGAYALNIGEHAVITLSTALAFLNGIYDSRGDIDMKLVTDLNGTPITTENSFKLGFDHNGDTVGLNLGAAWKGRISDYLSYTLGINGYSYDFDAKEKGVPDLSETVLRFSAGLAYRF